MTDDIEMRLRLQQVAAYRDLCRGVRRSGQENALFATIMIGLAWYFFQGRAAPGIQSLFALYLALGIAEFVIGLWKYLRPSAEGVLLDGIILLLFAAWNLGWQALARMNGQQPIIMIVFLGIYMLYGAIGRFKFYAQLRRMFAERPDARHLAWFDDLLFEIHTANPESDELMLDLPTIPHWKVKLLGTVVFFVRARTDLVMVPSADDFEIRREKVDHGTGRRRAVLRIHDVPYPEFEITDATWANYQNWRAANPLPQSPPSAVGGPG